MSNNFQQTQQQPVNSQHESTPSPNPNGNSGHTIEEGAATMIDTSTAVPQNQQTQQQFVQIGNQSFAMIDRNSSQQQQPPSRFNNIGGSRNSLLQNHRHLMAPLQPHQQAMMMAHPNQLPPQAHAMMIRSNMLSGGGGLGAGLHNKIIATPSTVFIGDIPKDVSQVELFEYLRENVGGEFEIVLKRPAFRYFYYAFCKFNDIYVARKLIKDIRYPVIRGKQCRVLPYEKDLSAKKFDTKTSLFIKGFSKQWTHKDFYEFFKSFGEIVSAKVSLSDGHLSRGYGFVQFAKEEQAQNVIQICDGKVILPLDSQKPHQAQLVDPSSVNLEQLEKPDDEISAFDDSKDQPSSKQNKSKKAMQPLKILPYVKAEKGANTGGSLGLGVTSKNQFNNLFVKQFKDPNITSEQLYEMFSPYGNIVSAVMMKKQDNPDENSGYGFVCFEDSEGARRACENMHTKDGLYVKRALKKQQRLEEVKRLSEKYKKSMQKFNLYVKNFPLETTEAELKEYFQRFGDVNNVKIMRKSKPQTQKSDDQVQKEDDNKLEQLPESLGFGFVSYTSAESAAKAKLEAKTQLFKDRLLIVCQYESKAVREAHLAEARDKRQFERYRKSLIGGANVSGSNSAASTLNNQRNLSVVAQQQGIPGLLGQVTLQQLIQLVMLLRQLNMNPQQNANSGFQNLGQGQRRNQIGVQRRVNNFPQRNFQQMQPFPGNQGDQNLQNSQAPPPQTQISQNQDNQIQQRSTQSQRIGVPQVFPYNPQQQSILGRTQNMQAPFMNQQNANMNYSGNSAQNSQANQVPPQITGFNPNLHLKPPPGLMPSTTQLFNWGNLDQSKMFFINKILERNFRIYGIRNNINGGLPNNTIFRKDIQSVIESTDYISCDNIRDKKELLGEILIDWVSCFTDENHAAKITGMMISLNDTDFNNCLTSLEIFRVKITEAKSLLQTSLMNKSSSSSHSSEFSMMLQNANPSQQFSTNSQPLNQLQFQSQGNSNPHSMNYPQNNSNLINAMSSSNSGNQLPSEQSSLNNQTNSSAIYSSSNDASHHSI
eukprot:403370981